MVPEPDSELLRLAEVRRFDFLYESKQTELRRICSITTTLLKADVAQVVMVDIDHICLLDAEGPTTPSLRPRHNSLSQRTVEVGGFCEVDDIP